MRMRVYFKPLALVVVFMLAQSSIVSGSSISNFPFVDTNVTARLWKAELNGSEEQIHKDGVEEFLTLLTSIKTSAPLSRSEVEITFLTGRLFTSLAKIDIANSWDRAAYKEFLIANMFTKSHTAFGRISERWGTIQFVNQDSRSYMAMRLWHLGQISGEVHSRYTYNMAGNNGRITVATPEHPSNKPLFARVTNAIAFFNITKDKHGFEDPTLKEAIRLGLASLKRDNIAIDLDTQMQFRPLQVVVDALSSSLDNKFGFWLVLDVELSVRGIEAEDCFFATSSPEELKKQLEFLRADFENCRTNKVIETKPISSGFKEPDSSSVQKRATKSTPP